MSFTAWRKVVECWQPAGLHGRVSCNESFQQTEFGAGSPKPLQCCQFSSRKVKSAYQSHNDAVSPQALDAELRELSFPVNQELDAVKRIVANPPEEVPEQLLRALEKDAKNLQKSLSSTSDILESRLQNLRGAAETQKVEPCCPCCLLSRCPAQPGFVLPSPCVSGALLCFRLKSQHTMRPSRGSCRSCCAGCPARRRRWTAAITSTRWM